MFKLLTILFAAAFIVGCSPNNVTINDSYEKYFTQNNLKGTFALYNNGQSNFIVYNLARYKDSSYSPGSSFDILNALIGLQTGIIPNETKVVADTSHLNLPTISLENAFKTASTPYFMSLSKTIGEKTMKYWLDSIKYGNKNIAGSVDSFWMNNNLKITADEELGMIEKVYFSQLPFQKRVQNIVKKLLIKENNANYQLAYKTGVATAANGHQIGWIVGWVEENKHPYFFVMNTESEKVSDMEPLVSSIIKPILKEQGFFDGKK